MDEENKGLTPNSDEKKETPQAGESAIGSGKTAIDSLPPDIQSYIDELRRENAKWRTEKKKADDAARLAEEKSLTERQEWKTLAEQRAARLAELEEVAKKAEVTEQAFNAALDARLKLISQDILKKTVEPIRASMNQVDFAKWLDANMELFTARKAPNLDAGAGGTVTQNVKLTASQQEAARKARMTDEQYIAAMKVIEAREKDKK